MEEVKQLDNIFDEIDKLCISKHGLTKEKQFECYKNIELKICEASKLLTNIKQLANNFSIDNCNFSNLSNIGNLEEMLLTNSINSDVKEIIKIMGELFSIYKNLDICDIINMDDDIIYIGE